jgi:hypothetical protein
MIARICRGALWAMLALSMVFPMGGPGSAVAQEVTVSVGPEMDPTAFQPVLSPYGEWVEMDGYGRVWRPNSAVVGADFTPYGTNGHWVYTDEGWVWVSDYAWGWAPFHYGSWVYADEGWVWIPGGVWAPAWVQWRYGGGYVGWAPLGPAGVVAVGRAYPARYSYVDVHNFTAVNIHEHLITGVRAEAVASRTTVITSAHVVDGRPVAIASAGPKPAEIARVTGHAVTPVPLHSVGVAPPASVRGVHYAAGADSQHPFAVRKEAPARASKPQAPPEQQGPSARSVAAAGSASHVQPAEHAPAVNREPNPAPERAAPQLPHTEPLHQTEAPAEVRPGELQRPNEPAKPQTSRPAPPPRRSAPHPSAEHEGGHH